MAGVNKVILIGHLGRDAELRYTPGGQPVATFSVATTEVWNDRQGAKQERTEWHRIVLWGKVAESLQEYLVKGKQVYIEGKIQTREWTDKTETKRTTTEIRADQVRLLSSAGGQGRRREEAQEEAPQPAAAGAVDDDEIPF